MRLRFIQTLFIIAALLNNSYADEGMWLLPLIRDLNMDRMKEMGLKLSAEDIYSVNHSSLKDMVGALDYGSCTAEIISDDGLILTNHHCAEDEIQNHSTQAHDYLRDGFWASSRQEELPNPGKSISFLVRMEDVTQRVLGTVNQEMSEAEREEQIDSVSRVIVNDATKGTYYEAVVSSFFGGNEFYLVVLETFRDVRLVGAPPESIGRFGYDSDNWEWPRHNADFSLMRIYTGPDGEPADYSEENIPYKPGRSLPISLEGYNEDDFTLIIGFPGHTQRFIGSDRVREIKEIENTNRIRIRGRALDLMKEAMLSNNQVRLQYSSKYSTLSNYYKYSIGQNLAIKNLHVIERRRKQEEALIDWADRDSSRIRQYGNILDDIRKTIEERRGMENALSYLEEIYLLYKPTEVIWFALQARMLYYYELGYETGYSDKEELVAELAERGKVFFNEFNPQIDKHIAIELTEMLSDQVDPLYYPDFFSTVASDYQGNIQDYIDHLYRKSLFADSVRFQKFIKRPRFGKLNKDPGFEMALSVLRAYFNILSEYEELNEIVSTAERKFISASREMYPDSIFYPDANSTLRLTYGKVSGYKGRDAVYFDDVTTLAGVMEKEDPENRDYIVPEKLKQIFRSKDYEPWVQGSTMPVCFLTNNDITGGNSGSPVLNARGELIGLAFDGNWEAMSGEIIFEKAVQRTICVDIRYILLVIDKYADADHLIREMNIPGYE